MRNGGIIRVVGDSAAYQKGAKVMTRGRKNAQIRQKRALPKKPEAAAERAVVAAAPDDGAGVRLRSGDRLFPSGEGLSTESDRFFLSEPL